MEQSKKKSLYLINLLTSSSSLPAGKVGQQILIFLLIGLILIGLGVLAYSLELDSRKIDLFTTGDTVEVLQSTTEPQNNNQEIVVEISGAVEKPNVYKLPQGSRIDDLLISAGGLSAEADRDWVEKNVNRAAKLLDGQKLYIYHLGEVSAKNTSTIKLDQQVLGTNNYNLSNLVNINSASQSELEKLTGIGPVYAQKIIEQRPYSNIDELVKNKVIPTKTFEKIKNNITIY